MRFKKIAALLTAGLILILSGCAGRQAELTDNKGDVFAKVGSTDYRADNSDDKYASYSDAALKEAAQILSQKENISAEDALKRLGGCRIETYFDDDAAEAIISALKDSEAAQEAFGCAVTDNKGHIIACCSANDSTEEDGAVNLAVERQVPYSSLKPLCVYAPAIESGLICWSTLYDDKPYKQLTTDSGESVDWPQNASGTYLNDKVTVTNALCLSLNTVAVRVLHDYGVLNAVELMQDKLGMPLEYEYEKAVSQGEDEVIGNVAMGYTYAGLSPAELAGYYSIFADAGQYTPPTFIKRITASDGTVIYENEDESVQVFSETTASIMNHMLQRVADSGATGAEAYIDGAFVAGKTGTGDYEGHWFVGTVPQYSCAVWCGGYGEYNPSPALFKEIVSRLNLDPNADYPMCGDTEQRAYCEESGLLAGKGCKNVNIGYYLTDKEPEICREHQ